jgi:hypothetical protein
MGDPTFAYHFAMATQADILRQAARDQQRWRGRPPGNESGLGLWALLVRRLNLMPMAHARGAMPVRIRTKWLED